MAGEPANPLRDAREECRIGIVLLAVFSLFINVLILTSPIYMMQVCDRVLSSGRLETLVLLTAIAGVAVFVLGLLELVRNKILARIGRWLDRRLSPELIRASLRAANYGGAPNAQPLRDLTQVRAFLGGPGCNTVFDVPWTPIFLTVIWLMHPILGMVGIGSAIALFILAVVNEYISRKPLKQSGAMSIANVQLADQAQRRRLPRHGHAARFPRGLDQAQRALAGPATLRRRSQCNLGRLLQVRPYLRADADPRRRRLSGHQRPIDLGR
jgi:ABC-type protease/lipase transport system fused ATPase/permease subunit